MRITITAKQLIDIGACKEGIEAFKKTFGDQAEVDWTLAVQIETLKGPLGRYVGWAHLNKLIPLWSMGSANLRGANLGSADLRSANLGSADLRGADLRSANLRSADLRGADLRSADLRSADLRSADLRSADLGSARVCLCNSIPCATLREALAAAGWVPSPDGLLARVQVAT